MPEVPKKAVPEDKMPKAVPKRKEPLPPQGSVNMKGKAILLVIYHFQGKVVHKAFYKINKNI